jgi:hypothetical protein
MPCAADGRSAKIPRYMLINVGGGGSLPDRELTGENPANGLTPSSANTPSHDRARHNPCNSTVQRSEKSEAFAKRIPPVQALDAQAVFTGPNFSDTYPCGNYRRPIVASRLRRAFTTG